MKLIVLQGCPCSGKTSWAKEYLKDHDVVYVNRDSIRCELNGGKYTLKKEDEVTAIESYRVIEGLDKGSDVIVDAANLNPKTINKWQRLADLKGAEIEFKEFFVASAIQLGTLE